MNVFGFFLMMILIQPSFLEARGEESPRTRLDVNHEVVRTYASIYLEQRDYTRAEEVIARYLFLSNEKGEGDLWHELGNIQLMEDKLPEACHSFQMAAQDAMRKESRLFGLYAQAQCLNRMGRTEDSKKVLTQMEKEESGVTNAATRVLELLKSGYIRREEGFPPYGENVRGQWRISAAVGAGYDTNVLLLADSVAQGVSAAGKASAFYTPAIQIGRVGRIFGDFYDSRFLSVYTLYTNPEASGFNNSYSRADFQVGSGPVRWGLFGDAYFLNRSPFQLYSYSGGLSWGLKVEHSKNNMTTLEVPIQYQSYPMDSGSNDRTGGDVKVKLAKRWTSGSSLTILQMIFDGQYTLGTNYRLGGLSFPVFYLTELPVFRWLGIQNTFSAEISGQYFFQSDSGRKDWMVRAGTGLSRSIGSTWNISMEISTLKNGSVLDSARYSKSLITAQLNHQF